MKINTIYTFAYATNSHGTNKRGFHNQLEYYRNLYKCIATGISLGYATNKDINNRQSEILDYETTYYVLLNVHLFPVNNLKNKLYLKAG